jgi:hypothetical protein
VPDNFRQRWNFCDFWCARLSHNNVKSCGAGNLVSGSGKWSLDKNQGRYVVELNFDIMNGAATQFHTSSLMLMLLAVIPCCIAGSVKKGESGLSFRRGRQLQQGELQRANPVERETCPEGANGYSSLPKASSKSRIVNLR